MKLLFSGCQVFGSFIFFFNSLICEIDSRLPKNQNTGIFGGSPAAGWKEKTHFDVPVACILCN